MIRCVWGRRPAPTSSATHSAPFAVQDLYPVSSIRTSRARKRSSISYTALECVVNPSASAECRGKRTLWRSNTAASSRYSAESTYCCHEVRDIPARHWFWAGLLGSAAVLTHCSQPAAYFTARGAYLDLRRHIVDLLAQVRADFLEDPAQAHWRSAKVSSWRTRPAADGCELRRRVARTGFSSRSGSL